MKQTKAYRSFGIWLLIVVVLVISSPAVFVLFKSMGKSEELKKTSNSCLQVEENCYDLELADTNEKRMKGLSGRAYWPGNQGMLFIFDQTEEQCFWMKDMKFNLDIVWADVQKKIIKVQENISPSTYPDSFCANNAKYVLEFNQGFASKYGLKAGTALQFQYE